MDTGDSTAVVRIVINDGPCLCRGDSGSVEACLEDTQAGVFKGVFDMKANEVKRRSLSISTDSKIAD